MYQYCEINGGKYIVTRTYDSERPSLNNWDGTEIMISVLKGDDERIDYPLLSAIRRIERIDENNITHWVFEFVNSAEALLYLNEAGLIKINPVKKFPDGANVIIINDDNIIMD